MAGGKIYHWKHGWIPLTRAALMSKLGKGPPPRGNVTGNNRLTNAERRKIMDINRRAYGIKPRRDPVKEQFKRFQREATMDKVARDARRKTPLPEMALQNTFKQEAVKMKQGASTASDKYRTVDEVDGVEFVTYKASAFDPLTTEHGYPRALTRDQMQIVADAYNEVKAEFPNMKPVQIVGVDDTTGAFGITTWDGRRISVSSRTFDPAGRTSAALNWGDQGALSAQYTDNPEGFARSIMIHELGHALQMQNPEAMKFGRTMANERVKLADVGLKVKPEDDTRGLGGERRSQRYYDRWAVDTLGGQSVYATGNEFEYFAEAFSDGFLNEDRPTPAGKRVMDELRRIYTPVKTRRKAAAA